MKSPLFKRTGLFMKPASLFGWLLLVAALAFVVWSFFDIDSRSHSVSDTLINTAFRAVITALAYTVVAGLSSLLVKKS